jgi:predicted restriction endonuclease
VKDFSGSTKIKEVNDPKNLIGLCPNHHVLLDKGLLDLDEPTGH